MISVFRVNGHLLAQALFKAILFWKTWIFFFNFSAQVLTITCQKTMLWIQVNSSFTSIHRIYHFQYLV